MSLRKFPLSLEKCRYSIFIDRVYTWYTYYMVWSVHIHRSVGIIFGNLHQTSILLPCLHLSLVTILEVVMKVILEIYLYFRDYYTLVFSIIIQLAASNVLVYDLYLGVVLYLVNYSDCAKLSIKLILIAT